MIYECTCCNYKTTDSGAWCRHKKSQKHIKNHEDQKTNIQYSEIQILKEQLKSARNEKYIIEKQLEEQKNIYNKQLEEQQRMYEKQMLRLSNEVEYFKIQFEKELNRNKGNNITNNNTLNIVNYIINNHNDTPPIENCNDYLYILGAKDNEEMRQHMLFYNKDGRLPNYLGDYFTKKLKKDNIKFQSMFCTDISRNNYILRLKQNDKIFWLKDKGGSTIKIELINPILKFADIILNEKIKYLIDNNNTTNVTKLLDVLSKVKDVTIMDQILKRIGPSFQINETIINNALEYTNKK